MTKRQANRFTRFIIDALERRGKRAYSQEGEDLILSRYFGERNGGFFVDVGALHPFRFSNTYLFYKRGWRGINIDAMPGSMKKFKRFRPRDTNIEVAIGSSAEPSPYYVFEEPALNTFDGQLAAQRRAMSWPMITEIPLPSRTLSGILDEHLPKGRKIDFLTVDAEGRDLDVLKSNDWLRYRPEIVLAESLGGCELVRLQVDPVFSFLASASYVLLAKTYNTIVMVDKAVMVPS